MSKTIMNSTEGVDASRAWQRIRMQPADDGELLPLNARCPHCGYETDVGEIYSGHNHTCERCGAFLQATDDGERMWLFVEKYPPTKPLTGRQRTRRLWAKRGRR